MAKKQSTISKVLTQSDLNGNYVGGVINATEVVELVNITYRKNQVFYEGHDNLLPRSQCEVYRDRHYSDGHVETDEFFSLNNKKYSVSTTLFLISAELVLTSVTLLFPIKCFKLKLKQR